MQNNAYPRFEITMAMLTAAAGIIMVESGDAMGLFPELAGLIALVGLLGSYFCCSRREAYNNTQVIGRTNTETSAQHEQPSRGR
jgi:hypothetical protein